MDNAIEPDEAMHSAVRAEVPADQRADGWTAERHIHFLMLSGTALGSRARRKRQT